MAKKYFDTFSQVTLHNGDTYNTPNYAKEFLENTYGPNWVTPIKNSESGWVNGKYANIN